MKKIKINFKDGSFGNIKCEQYATEDKYICFEGVIVHNDEELINPTFIIYNMDEIRLIIVEFEN